MRLKERLETIAKSANEAYLNSLNLNMVYSSNPCMKTRTSEAKRYAALTKELRNIKFALACQEIEATLPNFAQMTLEEICIWADAAGNVIDWFPCGNGAYETVILHQDSKYYLAIISYSEDGWIATSKGVRITPRIADKLIAKGLSIVEN